jgi:hypothetical protein
MPSHHSVFARDEKGKGRMFTHPLARPTGRAILPGPCSEAVAAWCGRGDHKQAPRNARRR